jgi:hypothetical protein
MGNTELRYRTFDQLLNEVGTDFVMYNNEGLIEPAQMIKVAQRVNYELGLRIHGTKEVVLELNHGKAKLPDDFYVLNYAFLCGEETVTRQAIQGRQTENVILSDCNRCGAPTGQCGCECTYAVECKTGEKVFVQVVEKRKFETRTYSSFERLGISPSSGKRDALDDRGRSAFIKNGFIYVNLGEFYQDVATYDNATDYGVRNIDVNRKVFISYEGALEDDDGNLLVLDHPLINEFYEYAIKSRLLENLFLAGEDVAQKIQLIEPRLKAARNNAISLVNMPNFSEMYAVWRMNRKAMYARYYDMFKSVSTF